MSLLSGTGRAKKANVEDGVKPTSDAEERISKKLHINREGSV